MSSLTLGKSVTALLLCHITSSISGNQGCTQATNWAPWWTHNNNFGTLAIWISCSFPHSSRQFWLCLYQGLYQRFYVRGKKIIMTRYKSTMLRFFFPWKPSETPSNNSMTWRLVTLWCRPRDISLQQVSLHSQSIHTLWYNCDMLLSPKTQQIGGLNMSKRANLVQNF